MKSHDPRAPVLHAKSKCREVLEERRMMIAPPCFQSRGNIYLTVLHMSARSLVQCKVDEKFAVDI